MSRRSCRRSRRPGRNWRSANRCTSTSTASCAESEDRLDDALKAFEEAARLDPEAPAPLKAQVPILLAPDRMDDALAACKKVVALDPGDYATWYVQAKLHQDDGQLSAKPSRRWKAPEIGIAQGSSGSGAAVLFRAGRPAREHEAIRPAADAFNKAAAILEHPDRIMEKGHVPRGCDPGPRVGNLREDRPALPQGQAIRRRPSRPCRKPSERAPERAGSADIIIWRRSASSRAISRKR